MKVRHLLADLKHNYDKGENIIKLLKTSLGTTQNSDDIIMTSYDLQSGKYIENSQTYFEYNEKYTSAIAKVVNNLTTEKSSIMEAGVGEATTLTHVISKLETLPSKVFGFDLSWSRIRYAKSYFNKYSNQDGFLFAGNLFDIPLMDSSIDIVYTAHSIEPNGGREREALQELYRVTNKYLILIEPSYEFASDEGKKRMETHGYIKNLYGTALSLGYEVIDHRPFDISLNPLNPSGIILIRKKVSESLIYSNPLMCPITKSSLELVRGSYFTEKGLLVYPVIDGVACLARENAIIATHYMDDFEKRVNALRR
ncbi:class I SAM-dependent methyltransferase [Candidatus Dojkabacteria bacterium]|nr:class I SAM-dependent methyltransferase [Candidatus Dojkabacteria bacterium]